MERTDSEIGKSKLARRLRDLDWPAAPPEVKQRILRQIELRMVDSDRCRP